MTDRAIAGQLKALADGSQRRAEKASHDGAAKALAQFAASSAELEWCTRPDGQRCHEIGAWLRSEAEATQSSPCDRTAELGLAAFGCLDIVFASACSKLRNMLEWDNWRDQMN
jgi:hypothetical protein